MGKKKEVYLELTNDIPTLIEMQKCVMAECRKNIRNEQILLFEEDVLKCLQALNNVDHVYVGGN